MRKAALVLALLLAATAAPAAQRWAEDYERGLAAVAAQDWSAAATAMASAARQNPNEAVALKLRRRTVAYVPWYWLGVAQLQRGDPAAALDAFRSSERQGVIAKTALYGDFRKAMSRAQAAVAQPAAGARAPGAAAFQDAVRSAVAAQGKAMLAGSTRTDTYRQASLKLQEARERAKGETAEGLAEGAKLAMQADELFRRAAAEQASARKTSKTVRSAMQPAAPPAEVPQVPTEAAAPRAVAAAPETVAEAEPEPEPAAAPSPRLVERTTSMLRSLRKEASSDRAKGDPRVVSRGDLDAIEMRLLAASTDEEVARIQKEIGDELTALRAITSAAPKAEDGARAAARASALESAYRALAAGEPEESERILSDLLATTESAEAYLLRGCARYTQGTLTKRKDLLDAAREDLGRALRLNRRLQLDARFFSPKVIELLDEVRRSVDR